MPARGFPEKLGRLYRGVAVFALHTVLLLVVLNGLAAGLLAGREAAGDDAPRAWLIEKYGFERLARGYPGWDHDALRAFLAETSHWENEYEAFTQFRQRPRRDRFITISEAGFRPVPDQAPWPPDPNRFNVFVFGGSTTMGAGVPDRAAIPARMSELAARCERPVAVYNFGRGYYFSSQERALFERLLLEGRRPDLAVFIDGLNDFFYADGVPQWTARLAGFMDAARRDASPAAGTGLWERAVSLLRALPLTRLAARLRGDAGEASLPRTPLDGGPTPAPEAAAHEAIERWEANRRMVEASAEAFGIATAFVWQPVPTYAYDLSSHHLWEGDDSLFGGHVLSRVGYRLMDERRRSRAMGPNFLWLGDLQRGRRESLYVDAVHYDEAFSREIAQEIFAFLRARLLWPCPDRTGPP